MVALYMRFSIFLFFCVLRGINLSVLKVSKVKELIEINAIERNEKFIMREGDHTVGEGVITEILEYFIPNAQALG